jgi:hypothetical protein
MLEEAELIVEEVDSKLQGKMEFFNAHPPQESKTIFTKITQSGESASVLNIQAIADGCAQVRAGNAVA